MIKYCTNCLVSADIKPSKGAAAKAVSSLGTSFGLELTRTYKQTDRHSDKQTVRRRTDTQSGSGAGD
eukprot:760442-Hanusia_phi.AAC.1